jgi:hypothetical protein
MKPIGIKKRTLKQVYDGTLFYINNLNTINGRPSHWKGFFWKEEIAKYLKVKTSLVEQVLHKMNLEGLVSQPVHHAPHDSNRDPWSHGGRDSSWMGDIYYIRNYKEG